MNADTLLKHFDRISEAPDAVARLRRFVLDLAVHGKLVEQDSSDEPATELLKRIQSEVQRRKQAGTYSDPRNSIELPPEMLPFDAPGHWKWTRLIEVADISYGYAFESARFNEDRRGMPLIRIRDISNTDTEAYFDGEYDESYIVRQGDYLVGMDGNFSLRKWAGGEALLNQRVMRIKNWKADLVADFLAIPLQMILDFLHGKTSQTTVKHLSAKQMNGVHLPLPPLAEQQRIVAKVDELMALCDQLEAAKNEREARRDRLVAASLHRIGTVSAAEGEAQDAAHTAAAQRQTTRFHLDHLPRLTTRPEHIKQLRQTILNLAVCGRLTPQLPTDEPVAGLLKRIEGERERLVKAGDIRPSKSSFTTTIEAGYDLPASWQWVRLGNIVTMMDAGWSPQCENHPRREMEAWGVLKTTSVQPLAFDCAQHKELPGKFEPRPSYEAKIGDILVTRAGPKNRVGISCVVDKTEPRLMISDKLIRFRLIADLSPRFCALALNAGYSSQCIEEAKSGMAVMQMNISQDKLKLVPIPLPPLAEQHRIVAKVDELMALCDQLETQLATSEADSRRLLEAVLRDALAPALERAA